MNLAFFASHRGSNMQAVLDACRETRLTMRPVLAVSNNRKSEALVRAREAGLATRVFNATIEPDPLALDQAMLDALLEEEVDLVILAGYLKCLGPKVVGHFRNRILNIHPALLPQYGGQGMFGRHVHEAVIAAGETTTGVTIHLVDEEYDHGATIARTLVPVHPGDTAGMLAERVLQREHEFLVEVLEEIQSGKLLLPPAGPALAGI